MFHSSELTRVNTLGDPNFTDSVGSSMVLRQAVISISHQLEDAESEYLSSRKELELVEIELSSVRRLSLDHSISLFFPLLMKAIIPLNL